MNDPQFFMRENIKGKSDISRCDHGDWFRAANDECTFIEGRYIINGKVVILDCNMLQFIQKNKIQNQFNCQNCGDTIMDYDLTEFLLCANCTLTPCIITNFKLG